LFKTKQRKSAPVILCFLTSHTEVFISHSHPRAEKPANTTLNTAKSTVASKQLEADFSRLNLHMEVQLSALPSIPEVES